MIVRENVVKIRFLWCRRKIIMIMINAKYYNRLARCWKRSDSIFDKRQKIYTEIERICSDEENNGFSKQEVIETLIADYKGQISNNNFMQFTSLIFSVLLLVLGFILKETYLIFMFFALIIVILVVTLYCLRYLYAEGFVLHILEEYDKKK